MNVVFPIFVIARFTLLEAVKSRMLWLMVAGLIPAFSLTEFIGSVAITESLQIKSALLGAGLRLFAVFTLALFVSTSMLREWNDKGMELVLSLPIPRGAYYLGKLLGFCVVALATAVLITLGLALYVPFEPLGLWGLSLACELFIVTAVSLLSLISFSQVTTSMSAVFAFYLLARSINAIQLMGRGPLVDTNSFAQEAIRTVVDGLAYVLPDLQRFTQSEWLAYHNVDWERLSPIIGESLIYVSLLAAAGLFDLYRRNL
jgi:ABC-type transport system involved in multi-copper enzyme maturation permease subunit